MGSFVRHTFIAGLLVFTLPITRISALPLRAAEVVFAASDLAASGSQLDYSPPSTIHRLQDQLNLEADDAVISDVDVTVPSTVNDNEFSGARPQSSHQLQVESPSFEAFTSFEPLSAVLVDVPSDGMIEEDHFRFLLASYIEDDQDAPDPVWFGTVLISPRCQSLAPGGQAALPFSALTDLKSILGTKRVLLDRRLALGCTGSSVCSKEDMMVDVISKDEIDQTDMVGPYLARQVEGVLNIYPLHPDSSESYQLSEYLVVPLDILESASEDERESIDATLNAMADVLAMERKDIDASRLFRAAGWDAAALQDIADKLESLETGAPWDALRNRLVRHMSRGSTVWRKDLYEAQETVNTFDEWFNSFLGSDEDTCSKILYVTSEDLNHCALAGCPHITVTLGQSPSEGSAMAQGDITPIRLGLSAHVGCDLHLVDVVARLERAGLLLSK